MRLTKKFAAILFVGLLAIAASAAESPDAVGDWRITLLKPADCYTCSMVEELLKRRGAIRSITLNDGRTFEVTATIERRAGGDVTATEYTELTQLPYFNATLWKLQKQQKLAQVLLKHDGHIVSAGSITESADLRNVRIPDDITLPGPKESYDAISGAYSRFQQEMFLRQWNLDWFLQLARHPELAQERGMERWLTQRPVPTAPALPQVSVVLATTASGALDNPIFNAIRNEEITTTLTRDLALPENQLLRFYGAGQQPGPNALEATRTQLRFVQRDLPGAQAFTLGSLADVFARGRAVANSRKLLVFIGHGMPDGAPMWGQPAPLAATELSLLHRRGGSDDVLISGNCFGGVMAQAVSCGFFGARPDVVATGCQSNAAEVAASKDYLHVFFDGLSRGGQRHADADGDGKVSFDEAHWYATRLGDERNITYSTVDSLADSWFEQHPDLLPQTITVGELHKLAARATSGERVTLQFLSAGLDGSYRVRLQDLAEQAERWSANPEGPRPMLGQLARRLMYTQRDGAGTPALALVRACGNRAVSEFLGR